MDLIKCTFQVCVQLCWAAKCNRVDPIKMCFIEILSAHTLIFIFYILQYLLVKTLREKDFTFTVLQL